MKYGLNLLCNSSSSSLSSLSSSYSSSLIGRDKDELLPYWSVVVVVVVVVVFDDLIGRYLYYRGDRNARFCRTPADWKCAWEFYPRVLIE